MSNFMLIKCYLLNLIDDIIIDFWSFINFVSTEDIRKNCNPIVDLSKFISNKKILSGIVTIVYSQTLSIKGLWGIVGF